VRNEDALGQGIYSAWVIDGATGLGKRRLMPEGHSDAQWLAAAYSSRLSAAQARDSIEDVFKRLIVEVRAEFNAGKRCSCPKPFELPSAGMVYVRLRDGQLEYARLGDCRVIIALPGGRVFSTGDSLLNDLDSAVLGVMSAMRRRTPSLFEKYSDLRAAVDPLLQANRSLLNTEGGYWALGIDPRAVAHMEVGALDMSGAAPVTGLLVSDGFYRLVDTFGVYDDASLLREALRRRDLVGMLAELRALEDRDPECTNAPRLKPKDDATAVLFIIDDGV
jgi:hypothetical protein